MGRSRKFMELVCEAALRDAKQRENDAAFGGERHDGGAREIRELVKAFRAGIDGYLPESFDAYAKQVEVEQDPEYEEFQRLKEKFEGLAK